MMAKPADLELDADEIVTAAIEILREQGLDGVSMRSVSARLGVSPVPLYSRIGNKDALLDAVADRLLADLAPPSGPQEEWTEYAARWTVELRRRLSRADSRLILAPRRDAYVQATRPLVAVMREGGLKPDAAVQACRLLMWATIGFVAMEAGVTPPSRARRAVRSGGDPGGVTPEETEVLFELQIRYLIEGIARDATDEIETDRISLSL
jgi:TetR/AcrR family transcriptional regulator, tetracycline repressor protein